MKVKTSENQSMLEMVQTNQSLKIKVEKHQPKLKSKIRQLIQLNFEDFFFNDLL